MATKIQLRRDLSSNWASTNPILAQGEPGVELDTNNMKIGDGVKAWNDLDYTVQAGGLQPAFFAISDYYSNTVSVSEDGIHWTGAVTTGSSGTNHSNDFEVNSAAIGNGIIVYRCYNNLSDKDELRYGSSPYQSAILPDDDVTRVGPNSEEINWETLTFGGGYFVAGGYYYDTVRNNINYPIAAYSADGTTWTKINIDLDYVKDIVDSQNQAYSNTAGGIKISAITYGHNGWLFSLNYHNDNTDWHDSHNRLNTGAFYTTNITTALNSSSYFASMPATEWNSWYDGHGWLSYYNAHVIYRNTSSDPRQGAWTQINWLNITDNIDFAHSGDYYGVNDITAGEIGGVDYMVISDNYGVIYYTTDQGTTWDYVTPGPAYAGIYELKKETNGGIKFSNLSNNSVTWGDPPQSAWNGEKITISGSYVVEMNGTWFLDDYDNNSWHLYHDREKSLPVNTTTFGTYSIVSKYVNHGYKGDNSLILPNVTNIVVGQRIYGIDAVLTAEDRRNDFPEPNLVTSVNTDTHKITLKYPLYQDFTSKTLYFQAVVKYTHGDEIRNLVYGDGKFVAFGNDTPRSYFTTNMTDWHYTVFGNPYNGTVIYGALDVNKNSMRTDSQSVPGFTNSLQLGDTFNVSVIALTDHHSDMGGDYYGKTMVNSGNIVINPTDSTWYFGVNDQDRGTVAIYSYGAYASGNKGFQDPFGPHDHNYQSGFDYYQHSHSISIETWNHNFYFDDYYGTFIASNIAIGNSNSYYDYYDYNHIDDIFFDGNDIFTSENHAINIYTYSDNGNGGIYIHWDNNAKIDVDTYGVTISENGYDWQFTSDNAGTLYAPDSSDINISGYWTIGQGTGSVGYPYIGAVNNLNTPTADAYDFVIQAGQSKVGDVRNYWYFNRDGNMSLPPSGRIDVADYWYIGNSNANIYATDIVTTDEILDIVVNAGSKDWNFLQDGKFQLPAGGDIVDSTGVSVLNAYRSLPQNARSSNYTLTLNDLGKHIYLTGGNISIPDDHSNNFSVGSTITVITDGQDGSYINKLAGVTLYQAGVSNAVADIELPKHAWSTVLKLAANVWIAKI